MSGGDVKRLRRARPWASLGMFAIVETWAIVSMTDPRSPGDASALQVFIMISILGLVVAGVVWAYFTRAIKRGG